MQGVSRFMFVLTQIANFTLLSSIVTDLILKSTPEIKSTKFKSIAGFPCGYKERSWFNISPWRSGALPIVAPKSGSNVSSTNLKSKLYEQKNKI